MASSEGKGSGHVVRLVSGSPGPRGFGWADKSGGDRPPQGCGDNGAHSYIDNKQIDWSVLVLWRGIPVHTGLPLQPDQGVEKNAGVVATGALEPCLVGEESENRAIGARRDLHTAPPR